MDWFFPLQAADGFIQDFSPPIVRVIFWSALAASFSMGIYAVTSPQEKLKDISARSRELMSALARHQGDFAEHMALTKQNLRLALLRIWHTIPPTIAALAPAIYILVWMESAFEKEVFFSQWPSWAQGWLLPAFVTLLVVSLAIKKVFRIE